MKIPNAPNNVIGTLILSRNEEDAASSDEAAALLADLSARIIHRGEQTMLIGLETAQTGGVLQADDARINTLRSSLPGWSVSLQGQSIALPDTRLKLRKSLRQH